MLKVFQPLLRHPLTQEKMRESRDAGLQSMTISLDGLETDHNWFRANTESYKRAIAAIGYSVNSSKQGMLFDVVTCVNQRNIRDIVKVKERLLAEGVKDWRLVSIFPKGRARDNKELTLSGEQLKQLLFHDVSQPQLYRECDQQLSHVRTVKRSSEY